MCVTYMNIHKLHVHIFKVWSVSDLLCCLHLVLLVCRKVRIFTGARPSGLKSCLYLSISRIITTIDELCHMYIDGNIYPILCYMNRSPLELHVIDHCMFILCLFRLGCVNILLFYACAFFSGTFHLSFSFRQCWVAYIFMFCLRCVYIA